MFNYLSFHLNNAAKPGCRATRPDIEPVDWEEEALEAERRQHPRYRVREGEFEVFSRDSKIIGKLNNISRDGLAFHYTAVEGRKAESGTINIMAKNPDPFFSAVSRLPDDVRHQRPGRRPNLHRSRHPAVRREVCRTSKRADPEAGAFYQEIRPRAV